MERHPGHERRGTDEEGNKRGFSLNSAPDDPELMFTTRLRDTAFKRVLKTMPLGTPVKLEGPFGDFTLIHNPRRPAVFLAGGIGVTPFRSIARWAAHQKLPKRIFLFYSNRRPEDAPFLDELAGLASAKSEVHLRPVDDADEPFQTPLEGRDGLHRSSASRPAPGRHPPPG